MDHRIAPCCRLQSRPNAIERTGNRARPVANATTPHPPNPPAPVPVAESMMTITDIILAPVSTITGKGIMVKTTMTPRADDAVAHHPETNGPAGTNMQVRIAIEAATKIEGIEMTVTEVPPGVAVGETTIRTQVRSAAVKPGFTEQGAARDSYNFDMQMESLQSCMPY